MDIRKVLKKEKWFLGCLFVLFAFLLASCDADMNSDALSSTPAVALSDTDGDGIADDSDNCPVIANSDQADLDGDGIGNVCDSDRDGDTIVDGSDNSIGAQSRSS